MALWTFFSLGLAISRHGCAEGVSSFPGWVSDFSLQQSHFSSGHINVDTDVVFPGTSGGLPPFVSLCGHSTSAYPKMPDLSDFLSYTMFFK